MTFVGVCGLLDGVDSWVDAWDEVESIYEVGFVCIIGWVECSL